MATVSTPEDGLMPYNSDAKTYSDLDNGEWSFREDGAFFARLPNGSVFRTPWDNGNGNVVSWDVSGTHDSPTLSPSIHANPGEGKPREWHGFLTRGEWKEC